MRDEDYILKGNLGEVIYDKWANNAIETQEAILIMLCKIHGRLTKR